MISSEEVKYLEAMEKSFQAVSLQRVLNEHQQGKKEPTPKIGINSSLLRQQFNHIPIKESCVSPKNKAY
jgi:hypothetical protein